MLQKIDDYVVICVNNVLLYQVSIINCQQSNQQHQAFGQAPGYDGVKIADIESRQKDILNAMEEINKYNQNEIQQLSALAHEYIAVKRQNAYKKCFLSREG